MAPTDDYIDDFVRRWKNAFGEELASDQARLTANRVLHLYRQLTRHSRIDQDIMDIGEGVMPSSGLAPPAKSEAV